MGRLKKVNSTHLESLWENMRRALTAETWHCITTTLLSLPTSCIKEKRQAAQLALEIEEADRRAADLEAALLEKQQGQALWDEYCAHGFLPGRVRDQIPSDKKRKKRFVLKMVLKYLRCDVPMSSKSKPDLLSLLQGIEIPSDIQAASYISSDIQAPHQE